ncbi:MAG: acyl-CoA dehydrogenase family protein [Rhodospirillales bacterium]
MKAGAAPREGAAPAGRARALIPGLRAAAAATEAARRVPDAAIAALRDAGLYRILQPVRFGGSEGELATVCDAAIEIGRGCAATAWVYATTATYTWVVGMFPPAAQEELWGAHPDAIVGASVAPSGKAAAADGGFRLAGTWSFSSGCDNADWWSVGMPVPAPDGGVEPALALLPPGAWTIEDNWHVLGLAGTGSKNVVVADRFVPAHRVLRVREAQSGNPPGAAVNRDPLYRVPMLAVIAACLAAPGIGAAHGALDAFRALRRRGSGEAADRAAAAIDAARTLLLRDCREAFATVRGGGALTLDQRLRFRRHHAFSVRLAVQAADALVEAAGGAALADAPDLQRSWRDAQAVAKHISLNWDAVGTQAGRQLLGLEPGPGQY